MCCLRMLLSSLCLIKYLYGNKNGFDRTLRVCSFPNESIQSMDVAATMKKKKQKEQNSHNIINRVIPHWFLGAEHRQKQQTNKLLFIINGTTIIFEPTQCTKTTKFETMLIVYRYKILYTNWPKFFYDSNNKNTKKIFVVLCKK